MGSFAREDGETVERYMYVARADSLYSRLASKPDMRDHLAFWILKHLPDGEAGTILKQRVQDRLYTRGLLQEDFSYKPECTYEAVRTAILNIHNNMIEMYVQVGRSGTYVGGMVAI